MLSQKEWNTLWGYGLSILVRNAKKIYRVNDLGISICTEKNGLIVPKKLITWQNILSAGEGVMTSRAYQTSRDVAQVMTDTLPRGRHPEQFEKVRSGVQQITGLIMIAYTKDSSKKLETLPINVSAPVRQSFLQDLSSRLGDRWLGEDQNPSELKKRIGIPLVYQIRGTIVFVILMLTFAALIYFLYFK